MTKDDAAWLLVRFPGIVCLVFAVQSLLTLGFLIPDLISDYQRIGGETERQLRAMATDSYWRTIGSLASTVVSFVVWIGFGLYCVFRGERIHRRLVR